MHSGALSLGARHTIPRVTSREVVDRHRAAGRFFEAAGVRSFVREEGAADAEVVLCLHGVPSSCFLYRKVLPELAARGLRGVAFDLPGLGLADRPEGFDYRWTGLGRFAVAAVEALGLDSYHLVVHDIPVGLELAAAEPERIRSLTILNSLIAVDGFKRPWNMEPFARRGLGELWLRSLLKPAFRQLMWLYGIEDRAATPPEELDAWVDLLKREDGGRAFLRIMRGFERTREKQELYLGVAGDERYPRQVVWGENDHALRLDRQGEAARRAARVERIHVLPAKHFLQEDHAPAIAERVAALASQA
jgi:haloalkane dehalogenase